MRSARSFCLAVVAGAWASLAIGCVPRSPAPAAPVSEPADPAAPASPALDPDLTRCDDGRGWGEPIEVPTGFTVRFPASWERLGQPFGIATRDPGQRVIVAFSGTYRAADLERHKRISESVFPGASVVQDWREEKRHGRPIVTRIVRDEVRTTTTALFATATGHVVATIEVTGTADAQCEELTLAILDGLKVGEPFDPAALQDDLATCPAAVHDAPRGGGVCLDGAVLEADVVERCGRALTSFGWMRADGIAAGVAGDSVRPHCYAAPP